MPTYKFEALDTTGFEVQDYINALSEEDAQEKIKQLGYFVTKITKVADAEPNVDSDIEFELALDESDSQLAPAENVSGERDNFETDFEVPALDESGLAQAAHGGSRKIGEVLIDLGYLDEDQLWEVLVEAKKTGKLTGQVAVARGLITEDQLLAALAERHNLKVILLEGVEPTAEALQAVPETMASAYKILPLAYRDSILTLVLSDPRDLAALEDLRNLLGCKEVRAYLASALAIAEAQVRAYAKEESISDLINSLADDLPRQSENSIDLGSLMEIQDAAPVRKLVNMVMLLAIKDKASDIHFEPFEDEYKLRYRCDGTLYELVPPPRHLGPEIADRIKVMANLDTAEHRLPQYGRIDLNVAGNPVPMRVSVLPTMFGENVAIRVLDGTVVGLDLNRVGMDPALLTQFREMIHKPNGIVLVTGPTGAGKTTTLYSALSELNEITDKIITAEDPVEYEIDGIVRCQIHDLTIANALRSILGQDPDIIVVGTIRDHETAQIAVQAALCGRLVLSTLDATDAASSITRLRGMGLEPSLIAATVKAILAQRLVRKICENCRTEFEPSPEMLMELNLRPADVKGKKFYYGRSCERCNNMGHGGRCGVFELVMMNDELRDMISSGASTDQLRTACWGQGMTTLREAGLKALFSGVTTVEEVVRETVLKDRT
jgi:type IV pilus assembly protein PilB